jgi:hypothetical protein
MRTILGGMIVKSIDGLCTPKLGSLNGRYRSGSFRSIVFVLCHRRCALV